VVYKCMSDSEGDSLGYPIIAKSDECEFEIIWYSKFACPICNQDELVTNEGKCH